MRRAKILIVEDEPLIADDISEILQRSGYRIAGVADEAAEALSIIIKEHPDLALLDVNIEGDMDGIELAAQLKIPFVFLTSYYDQKTLDRAKRTGPSGYIVKPFNENELIANVEVALFRSSKPIDFEHRKSEKLFVRKDQEIISILSDDIIYVEAFDNYANVFTAKDKYIISHTLKSIEEKLLPLGFMRVHRSYLINFDKIDSISEGYVFLDGHKVQLGKSYKREFFDKLSML